MTAPEVKDKTFFQSLSSYEEFKYWLTDHKLQALGTLFLCLLLSLFYSTVKLFDDHRLAAELACPHSGTQGCMQVPLGWVQ
jgi:hypothetical protein